MRSDEKEILSIAQEESAEIIQAISKIFRFGLDTVHEGVSNREHLEVELGDLQCMIDLMIENGIVRQEKMWDAQGRKFEKLKTWSNIFGGK